MPMRPVQQRLSANGVAPWIPLNRYSTEIAIALGVQFSSNGNLEAEVQYTLDPLVGQPAHGTRSTTTVTLTLPNHGLDVDDSVVVKNGPAPFAGTFPVASVVDQNNITYTVADSGAAAAQGLEAIPLRVIPHPVLDGLTDDADSNFAYPPTACRLAVSNYVAGYVDLNVVSGGK